MRSQRLALAAAVAAAAVSAHPQCLDASSPSQALQDQLSFCNRPSDAKTSKGACCSRQQELAAKAQLYTPHMPLSDACKPYQRQVACGSCSPYAAHIASAADGLTGMCAPFCGLYVAACGAELGLAADFCATRSTASAYCYPDYAAENLAPSSTALQPYWPRLDGHGKLPTQPVGMFMKPGGNSWWIVNQRGQISQIRNIPGAEQLTPILDISDRVIQGGATGELGEMGLLGLAFSPDFLRTGYFYVNYINLARFTVVARFTFASGKPKKTAASEVQILSHWQPYENHNGGTLLFEPGDLADPYAAGKTGYNLYIPTGDGGLYGDPENRAQDVNVRYGKILRITLPAGTNEGGYSIPEGNISAEVWAYGFRNPWKCTFDRAHLDAPQMWCGDVGQDKFEKVIRVLPRQNHGWRNYEGSSLYSPPKIAYVDPDFEYCHGGVTNAPKQCGGKTFTGESVTGGYIYRGTKQADMYAGQYIFADWQSQKIVRMFKNDDGTWGAATIIETAGFNIPSLAEDNDGELYILSYGEQAMVYALPDTVILPPLPTTLVQGPALLPGQFIGAQVVDVANDLADVQLVGETAVGYIDPGDAIPYTFNVAEAGQFQVAYTVTGAPPTAAGLSMYLRPGRDAVCDPNKPLGGEGAMNLDYFNTGNAVVAYRANDVNLTAGDGQVYTLCFARAAYVTLASVCIAKLCAWTEDARVVGAFSAKDVAAGPAAAQPAINAKKTDDPERLL